MKASDLGRLVTKVLHVCWMSVALGVGIESLSLFLTILCGSDQTRLGLVASVLARISWSLLVCTALAVTTALPRGALPVSGLAGLLVAPAATVFAKLVSKFLTEALSNQVLGFPIVVVFVLAALKAVEYLWLGSLLAWLGKRGSGFGAAVLAGGGTGLAFGVLIAAINVLWLQAELAVVVSGFFNELGFPIGCAIVLYGADQLARRWFPPTPEAEAAA